MLGEHRHWKRELSSHQWHVAFWDGLIHVFIPVQTFVDITDVSIVVYGSPGSRIKDNMIMAEKRNSMAGVLLADYAPWDGNYTDTVVINNTITAGEGTLIRVGIGIGPSILSDDTESVLFGGTVKQNILKGLGMGYGIAAAGVRDFIVIENESMARHGGRLGARCFVPLEANDPLAIGMSAERREMGVVKNPQPVAFLKNGNLIQGGEWQDDFVDADFLYRRWPTLFHIATHAKKKLTCIVHSPLCRPRN